MHTYFSQYSLIFPIVGKNMTIYRICFILSVFSNCFLLSLGKENVTEVRKVTASKISFYSDNDDEFNMSSPLQAILMLYDEGTEVKEIKVGDRIQLKMKVRASEEFNEGVMIRCFVSSEMHPDKEKNIFYDACNQRKNIIQNWFWDKRLQSFMVDFSVIPLFFRDIKNISVTMSCNAIVCLHKCPKKLDDYCT